ncbi:cyclic di-GMP phosphodiesterase response regulator RpfG [Clostridium homopropionicum DSM 5847]|uniref:Stage 0 sporulation protein A homolog n=1 Tax=Clostridium homopropionicum DSM 5847 TaxID=1121318 RepID=A0A0L6ZAZ6_9CLOT|nr:HD domain-containing phosphohydrolase [Clostridium homopropionicum]KOA20146.1 cyclic di-GMP phosphodiesterase response regulator RpfG [Clostridium homopropionicum DSM 5847]SFG61389.1 Response regulator c-di-GMP phosphodiesterase, RpfG family, contains REC and HD-GYP domains [Clostridium homopropionicum]
MQTIMVVDDELMITKTLSLLLKMKTKQNIVTFNTPTEALYSQMLQSKEVDVIVSDFIMPEMNGIEFLMEVKKISPKTETILLTGYADKENAIRSINEVGVYYYLEKPWNNEELIKIINNALDKKRLSDELKEKIKELEASNNENRRLYELTSKEYNNEIEGSKSLMLSLANIIEAKDIYTDGHTRRVSSISSALGKSMNLSKDQLDTLEVVGIIHDVGKVAIPEQILNKAGKLTDEEFKIIKKHPEIGEKICRPLGAFNKYLGPILHHHEKLNGKGYPHGLKGDEIDVVTRIITIVDIFDALYSDRPYRSKMPIEKVKSVMMKEVEEGYIDKQIVNLLFYLIETGKLELE